MEDTLSTFAISCDTDKMCDAILASLRDHSVLYSHINIDTDLYVDPSLNLQDHIAEKHNTLAKYGCGGVSVVRLRKWKYPALYIVSNTRNYLIPIISACISMMMQFDCERFQKTSTCDTAHTQILNKCIAAMIQITRIRIVKENDLDTLETTIRQTFVQYYQILDAIELKLSRDRFHTSINIVKEMECIRLMLLRTIRILERIHTHISKVHRTPKENYHLNVIYSNSYLALTSITGDELAQAYTESKS